MKPKISKFPFEASPDEILLEPDPFIDAVFSCLESEFLQMPKGNGFISFPEFDDGYEALKRVTDGFIELNSNRILRAATTEPLIVIVLRAMLGFTPPEWAYVATRYTGVEVTQGFVRSLDRNIRMSPGNPLKTKGVSAERVQALIQTACHLLTEGVADVKAGYIHRLDKADTARGARNLRNMAKMGAPYSILLYERFLGRPFAGHRDSVSDLIGGGLESAIEATMDQAGVTFRKTGRAEKFDGFDQTPDFIVPNEFNPQVVIEAKITEDDGTARDKATRIQHLAEISRAREAKGHPPFEVIVCIGGRGFGVRREDMKKMLIATQGKIFTLQTLDRMVATTRLGEFASRAE
jgi:hypothetical protein